MKVSELSRREIINTEDGSRLGSLKDLVIDPDTGQIQALILQGGKKYGFWRAEKDLSLEWKNIQKIGLHTILVEQKLL